MTKRYTALVLGATGLVGQHLLKILASDPRYCEVTCLLRRPLPSRIIEVSERAKLQPVVVDFEAFDQYEGYFRVDHVYVCLGTTIKKAKSREAFRKVDFQLVHAAAQMAGLQGCRSFVWLSSVGADATSSNFYLRVKGELENAIMNMPMLNNAHGLRPSLLLGDRQETRPAEQLAAWLAPVLTPLLIGPLRKYRPVHAIDVANQMIALQHFDDAARQ